jgi:hypothetical protein
MMSRLTPLSLAALAACALLSFDAAAQAPSPAPAARPGGPARNIAQLAFATPESAAAALADAMRSGDWKKIYAVLGPGSGKLIYTGDKVADTQLRENFVAAYATSLKIDRTGDAKATLLLGENGYPFPYPLVNGAAGWMFDARAGADEILDRRIGRNELSAMQVCLAYVDAQREYVLKDRDNNGLLEYAQRLVSTPGKRDGLYWPTAEGEPPSPLGPLAQRAAARGYGVDDAGEPRAYHGYHYRILTAQGPDAPGGAYDYLVKGKMIGGFALVAYPARWGASGVMTFVCNHDGAVYEKNLGSATVAAARQMKLYNPDATWTKMKP